MVEWLEFEEQCTQYLNKKFGDKATFSHLGSADSTVPDICVETKTGKKFYMDAKMTPAQCGQFVLLPDVSTGRFVFSEKNKTSINSQVQTIIRHMNTEFEAYKEAGTAGRNIDLGDDGATFADWIISAYAQKGTEFFITDEYTILPICDFDRHFHVTATYRVKRSGSRKVGVRSVPAVVRQIEKCGFPIQSHRTIDGKLFVDSSACLHDQRFVFNGSEYMFSQRGDMYEIRVLSNTFHANVIFSITKKRQKGIADLEFAQYLDR